MRIFGFSMQTGLVFDETLYGHSIFRGESIFEAEN